MSLKPTVIYDGKCGFCKSCVDWLSSRCEIEAIPNQDIEPRDFGLTREQCEKSVVVIESKTYFGANAVALLLKRTGHPILGNLLKGSGALGEFGYKYVASHRNGLFVALLHRLIKNNIKRRQK